MATVVAAGGFAAPTTGTTPVAQTITLPSGSAPKAIVLQSTMQTSQDVAPTQGNAAFCQGMASFDGGVAQQFAFSAITLENQATSDSGRVLSKSDCLLLITQAAGAAPVIVGELSLVSMSDTQVALQWDVIPSSAFLVTYEILGGSDIAGGFVSYVPFNSITTGANYDVPLPAGWTQPKAVIALRTNALADKTPANSNASFGFGAAVRDGSQRAGVFATPDGQGTMSLGAWMKDALVLALSGGAAADMQVNLAPSSEWVTDSYRLTQPDPPPDSTFYAAICLALKGTFSVTVGTALSETTANAVQSLAHKGGAPRGALQWGVGLPVPANGAGTVENGHADLGQFMFGGWDAKNQFSLGLASEDGATTSNTGGHTSATKAFRSHVPNATLTSPPILTGEATGALGTSEATLTWGDPDTLGREFNFFIVGDAGGVTTVLNLTATSSVAALDISQIYKNIQATAHSSAISTRAAKYLRTIIATSTTSAARAVQLYLTRSATSTASIQNVKRVETAKSATSVVSATVAISRAFLHALAATVTGSASLSRQTGKNYTASTTTTAVVQRALTRSLTATVNTAPAIQRYLSRLWVATTTSGAITLKNMPRSFSVTATGSASQSKQAEIGRLASVTTISSIRRLLFRNLSAVTNITASLSAIRTYLVSLIAPIATSAEISRQTGKSLGVSVPTNATRNVFTYVRYNVTTPSSAVVNKAVNSLFAATSTGTATAHIVKVKLLDLIATVTGSASAFRQVGLNKSASVGTSSTVRRDLVKLFTQSVATSVFQVKRLAVRHTVGVSVTPTLEKRGATKFVAQVVVTVVPTLSKRVIKLFARTVMTTTATTKHMPRDFTTSTSTQANMTRRTALDKSVTITTGAERYSLIWKNLNLAISTTAGLSKLIGKMRTVIVRTLVGVFPSIVRGIPLRAPTRIEGWLQSHRGRGRLDQDNSRSYIKGGGGRGGIRKRRGTGRVE